MTTTEPRIFFCPNCGRELNVRGSFAFCGSHPCHASGRHAFIIDGLDDDLRDCLEAAIAIISESENADDHGEWLESAREMAAATPTLRPLSVFVPSPLRVVPPWVVTLILALFLLLLWSVFSTDLAQFFLRLKNLFDALPY